ncbi:hypothetical protein [Micromonospora psammae]|uniref:hypothetical protein n=1 Tax=Micromonospora sp. CPCC 205556 TaxID=3122398 RepID=UPI002FEFD574
MPGIAPPSALLGRLKYVVGRFARAIAHDDKCLRPGGVEPQLAVLDLGVSALIAAYTQMASREAATA